jgi:glycosyltransferase involved in cell wall biosynthesis
MQQRKKKICFTVINDLTFDRRMKRICEALVELDFDVLLVGRELKNSYPLTEQKYQQKRLKCFINKGFLFYLEYNIRLFFYLLSVKKNIYGAVDLDTILPNFLVSKLKSKPLVYDAHEYFTELIEVQSRPIVKKIWQKIEEFCLSKNTKAYTVSQSYASLYKKEYGSDFEVIMNAPILKENEKIAKYDTFTFIYVGVVNAGRGLEECIEAIVDFDAHLRICGDGDILKELKGNLTEEQKKKVSFTGYLSPDELEKEIRKCHVGFLILRSESLSYYYSLANKFFDYVHAEIPQICIDFPEYVRMNTEYEVAKITSINKESIKQKMNELIDNPLEYNRLVQNTIQAKHQWNWGKEKEKLAKFYARY